jgi:DNA-binding NtrC family response regulator
VRRQDLSPLDAVPVDVAVSPSLRFAALTVPTGGLSLDALEQALIGFALERHAGNRTHAARFLRLSRSALLYRMRKYGLSVPPRRSDSPNAEDLLP